MLSLLVPKNEADTVAKAAVVAEVTAAPEKGMFVKKDDDDDMFGAMVKKSKAAKKSGAVKKEDGPKVVQLTMDQIGALANIGVEIPRSTAGNSVYLLYWYWCWYKSTNTDANGGAADLAAVIEKIKEKNKAFLGMNEEDKKKFKAEKAEKKSASAKSKEAKTPADSAEHKASLVTVDILHKGSDKVQVKLDFPPLSASA